MKSGYTGNVQAAYNQYQSNFERFDKSSGINKDVLDALMQTPIDSYTPSVQGAADPATIENLWSETNYVAEAVRKLVQSYLGIKDAAGQGFWVMRAKGHFKLSESERAQAQELISEDGFFGVKQTTDRIVGFAKALVGENASEGQIKNMRDAVQKGFDEVARLFGGFDNLPDVTKQTYHAIMRTFDEWLGTSIDEEVA